MTEVVYTGPYGAVSLADGTVLSQGEAVELDDETAEALAQQGDFTVTALTTHQNEVS